MAKKKSGPPEGRPTDYRPEYCAMLINHLSDGNGYVSFAASIGVSIQTLYDWEKKHPPFIESKRLAWGMYQSWWETEGKKGLYEQVLINEDGSKSILKMNATVWIYNMKCRFREDWHEAQKVDTTVTITDDAEMEQRIKEKMELLRLTKDEK